MSTSAALVKHPTVARDIPAFSRRILRYSADRTSVAIVLLGVCIALVPLFISLPLWVLIIYWPLSLVLRVPSVSLQHHHSHLSVFKTRILNDLYDVVMMLSTGYVTPIWELQHGRGHHRQYLDPKSDVTYVERFGCSKGIKGHLRYIVLGDLSTLSDSVRIGLSEKKSGRKGLLSKLAFQVTTQIIITGLLIAYNPIMAITFFVLPNLILRYLIWFSAYWHHQDTPTTDVYDSSTNQMGRFYNWLTFNSGHHTTHHEKPTMHWSLLPTRTCAILHRIPEVCLNKELRRALRPR